MSITYIILLVFIMCMYLTAAFLLSRNYRKNLKVYENALKEADTTIYELTKYNELLSKLVVKYQQETGAVFNVGIQTDANKEKEKPKTQEFDLDEILEEISKVGAANISKEKLDFLNKYKKQ